MRKIAEIEVENDDEIDHINSILKKTSCTTKTIGDRVQVYGDEGCRAVLKRAKII